MFVLSDNSDFSNAFGKPHAKTKTKKKKKKKGKRNW